ncbi:MAG TPA: DUF1080 domain-containing protein [Gemmataceae bacterium]|jgi:hypothetical protein|nr:DUF1080 domain-containing protein [Gemmataceae bacterium]
MRSLQSALTFLCVISVVGVAAGLAPPKDDKDSKAKPKERKEWKSGIVWPEPKVIDPGSATVPPSDAVVLFDGADMSKWVGGEAWQVKDGYAISRKTSIHSKDTFGDCQIHVEFATPAQVKGSGQGRGNSGVYIMGRYEVQILDSYDNKTYFDGQCGAIYKQSPPMVNACRKPGEWQTYDILWEAPRFKGDGGVERPAYVTVLHNGVAIQNHTELLGSTAYDEPPQYHKHPDRAPIELQFHGNPVRFRNIWVREMKPAVPAGKKSA